MVSGSKKRRSLSEDSSSYVSKKIKTTGSTKKAGEKVISASGLKDAEGNEYWEVRHTSDRVFLSYTLPQYQCCSSLTELECKR